MLLFDWMYPLKGRSCKWVLAIEFDMHAATSGQKNHQEMNVTQAGLASFKTGPSTPPPPNISQYLPFPQFPPLFFQFSPNWETIKVVLERFSKRTLTFGPNESPDDLGLLFCGVQRVHIQLGLPLSGHVAS
jgi:hypothetical protein